MVDEKFTIGIDDTGYLDQHLTTKLMRSWLSQMVEQSLIHSEGITRHQLFESEKISSSYKNRSLAFTFNTSQSIFEIEDQLVDFIRTASSPHANPAIAILSRHSDSLHALAFGRRCKNELLKLSDSEQYASESNVLLRGLGGNRNGMIGALAAVGLRAGGGDGIFVHIDGLEGLKGDQSAGDIRNNSALQHIVDISSGEELDRDDMVKIDSYLRPNLINGGPTQYVQLIANSKVWTPLA
jgi:hypothetical protein